MIDYIDKVKKFIKPLIESYDESHDIEHLNRVYKHVCTIRKSLSHCKLDEKVLVYSAYLHDVLDKKYADLNGQKEIYFNQFLDENCTSDEIEIIKYVCENVSYKRETTLGLDFKNFSNATGLYRNIVSDADKIDAIGYIGLDRVFAYSLNSSKTSEVLKNSYEHYLEKLDGLHEYCYTTRGRELAKEKREEMTCKNACKYYAFAKTCSCNDHSERICFNTWREILKIKLNELLNIDFH